MLVVPDVDAFEFRVRHTELHIASHGRKQSPQGFVIVAQEIKALGVLYNMRHDGAESEGATPILLIGGNS